MLKKSLPFTWKGFLFVVYLPLIITTKRKPDELMKSKSLLFVSLFCLGVSVKAQVSINVNTDSPGFKVSPDLYGIFFEDINHAADGGLYAELVHNRSFEDNGNEPVHWKCYGNATMKLVDDHLLNSVQKHAVEVVFDGTVDNPSGIGNEGFWGINVVKGRTYRLSFWAKGKLKGGLKAYLGSNNGKKIFASADIAEKITGKWTKYSAEFTATENDPKACLWITSDGSGKVYLDVVSLFPPTFKDRENGMRPDLANMLYDLHPKFMRFPGGCFVEGQDAPENAFHWEKTVGPIEERPGHDNVNWRYRTSDGMGFHEMLQLSEDLNAKPLYVVNVGIWHGGFTPVDSIQPWIDECMNALEYANGPVDSKYGAMRAENGHPEPFNIEYLEIGNENNQPWENSQSDHYYDRFRLFKEAVLAKYPNMHIIGDLVAWGDDNPKWGSEESCELLDEHYYRNPAWFAEAFSKYDTYERGKHDIYVGEYAVTQGFGKDGNLNAALGEAVYMMGIENNSDVVKLASYAPIFANVNDRRWSPDMIQFDGTHAYGTPSYYVQKMMADNVGTRKLDVSVDNPYPYEECDVKVKPNTFQLGAATWATQATFKYAGLETNNGAKFEDPHIQKISGEWAENGDEITQKSGHEGAVAVAGQKITADEYTFNVRARKDSGREDFMIVFNYVDRNNYCWVNFGGWNNTQHGVEQIQHGNKSQLATTPGSVETGRWYDVRLHVVGDSIYASLDGKQIFATKLKPDTKAGIFSTASLDENNGEVIVKIANTGNSATTASIDLKGYTAKDAKVIRLSSKSGMDENNLGAPTNVYPQTAGAIVSQGRVSVDVPAYSLNIVRIPCRKQ